MVQKIILAVCAAALVVLGLPSDVSAYGAAHVGYTHVGPNGVQHTGATAVSGPGGVHAAGQTSAYGYSGASYHSGSSAGVGAGGAYHAGYSTASGPGGASAGAAGYRYTPSYYGGASYGYMR